MRAPSDLRRRKTRSNRGRVMLIVLAVALVLLITSLRGLAGFYTDYLWFDSLGFSGVFRHVLGAKIALALIFTALFFVLCWINLWIADRIAPRFRPAGPEEEFVERYQELIGRRTGLVRIVVSLLFGLIAGVGTSSQWKDWILFTNRVDFGVADPLFDTDIGFYVFTLPFLRFLVNWLFAAVLIVIIITAVAHYLNGGIRVQTPGQRVTPQVKAHLSVLLAAAGPPQGVGVLAPALRADVLDTGLRQRCRIHRRQGTAPGDQPADPHLVRRRRAADRQHPASGLGSARHRRRVCGRSSRSSRARPIRRSSSGSRSSRPSRPRSCPTSPATSRRRARPWASTTSRPKTSRSTQDVTAADLDGRRRRRLQNIRLLDPERSCCPRSSELQGIRSFYQFNDLDVDRYDDRRQRPSRSCIVARELELRRPPAGHLGGPPPRVHPRLRRRPRARRTT